MRRPIVLNSEKIIAIHASAVASDGGAVVFLGPSGAGKTTICALLQGRTETLADDKVYLILDQNGTCRVADATRRVYCGTLSQQEGVTLRSVPLRAIVRLVQSSETRQERISAADTLRYLWDSIGDIYILSDEDHDPATLRAVFSSLANIVRSIPGYLLFFNLSIYSHKLLEQWFPG